MSEPEKVGGIRGINSDQINALVVDARQGVAQVRQLATDLRVYGVETILALPGLHPYAKLIFGDTLVIHSRIAPVPAVADPPTP